MPQDQNGHPKWFPTLPQGGRPPCPGGVRRWRTAVVRLSDRVQVRPRATVVELAQRRRWLHRSPAGRAAGLLAACLMLGVFLGAAAVPQPLIPALEDFTGISMGNANSAPTWFDPDEDLL